MRWLFAVLLLAGCGVARADLPRDAVLTASQPWEHGVVQEPNVWQDHGWHMVYTGGWDSPALGYATAPSPRGPWTKHGIVLGHGRGGWSGVAVHASTFIDRGTLYVYFAAPLDGADLHVAAGPDALHLRTLPEPALRRAGRALGIVNTTIVRDGSRYRMLFESNVAGSVHWMTGYAEGPSPTSLTIRVFPLPGLQRGSGMFGGPFLSRTATGYELLYHSARHGVLPTDIYRATSPDLLHWTAGRMVVRCPDSPGVDQAADADTVGGWLFYDVIDNRAETGSIVTRPGS